MTGLAQYTRDRTLPAHAGDIDLVLPCDDELLQVHGATIEEALGEDLAGVVLEHARWKPGTSVAGTWRAEGAAGATLRVTLKRYRGDKALLRAERARDTPGLSILASQRALLFTQDADLLLPGLAAALCHDGTRRLARLARESEAFGPLAVRKRASRLEVLRYKPERRAVCRFDVKLRGADGPSGAAALGMRVLPLGEAGRIVTQRRALAASSEKPLQPTLYAAVPHLGWLVEEWLPGDLDAERALHDPVGAGALLATLHAAPLPPSLPSESGRAGHPLDPSLFAIEPDLTRLADRLREALSLRPPLPPERPVWCHGDFHPDQILYDQGGASRLLDFDALGLGPREQDLATWIADTLADAPSLGLERAALPLLTGYGGCITDELRWHVAAELGKLAAAAIRRIEHHAGAKARTLLTQALRSLDA